MIHIQIHLSKMMAYEYFNKTSSIKLTLERITNAHNIVT